MGMEPTGSRSLGNFMTSAEAKRLEALYALEILDTPRQDVPSALRKHLTEALRDRDATIVKGWLEGIAEGGAEDLGLE